MRFCLLVLVLTPIVLRGDSSIPPYPRMTVSESGKYVFAALPAKWTKEGKLVREASGVAYELEENGKFRELWRTKGWFGWELFLCNEGRYLVRLESAPVGSEPSDKDVGVAFYDRGKLLRQHSTAELIKDKTSVVQTTSHYLWLAYQTAGSKAHFEDKKAETERAPALDSWDKTFYLKTSDGIDYTFDIATGKITEKK